MPVNRKIQISRFGGHYVEWRARRLNVIQDTFKSFSGMKIIELAAGYGELGAELRILGATVTFQEGRQSHIKHIKQNNPGATVICSDLNEGLPKEILSNVYDLGLHFGVFYHLSNPWESLIQLCEISNVVMFETECHISSESEQLITRIEKGYDQSLDKQAIRMTAEEIEAGLKLRNLKFMNISTTKLNTSRHVYNSSSYNTDLRDNGHRRMWIISGRKKAKFTLSQLKDSISTRLG